MKTLSFENKDMKTLQELLQRGLAYTDAHHYRDYRRMENLYQKVDLQLKNKTNFKQWLIQGIKDLEKERDYNEQLYKRGENPNWKPKDKASCVDILMNYWGYTTMIFQLENVLKKYEIR